MNLSLNDQEIILIQSLIKEFEDSHVLPTNIMDDPSKQARSFKASLRRLERKMQKALDHANTEFVLS